MRCFSTSRNTYWNTGCLCYQLFSINAMAVDCSDISVHPCCAVKTAKGCCWFQELWWLFTFDPRCWVGSSRIGIAGLKTVAYQRRLLDCSLLVVNSQLRIKILTSQKIRCSTSPTLLFEALVPWFGLFAVLGLSDGLSYLQTLSSHSLKPGQSSVRYLHLIDSHGLKRAGNAFALRASTVASKKPRFFKRTIETIMKQ